MTRAPRLIFLAALIAADQISKWVMMEHVFRPEGVSETPFYTPYIIELLPVLNLRMAWNTGVSFSLFSDTGNPWILIGLTGLITLWLARWLWTATTALGAAALALIVGGAIGNLIDRIRFGAVADFIDFHIGAWHFPTFNVADSAITIGAILFLIDALSNAGFSGNQDASRKE